jgi:hypothetical protein
VRVSAQIQWIGRNVLSVRHYTWHPEFMELEHVDEVELRDALRGEVYTNVSTHDLGGARISFFLTAIFDPHILSRSRRFRPNFATLIERSITVNFAEILLLRPSQVRAQLPTRYILLPACLRS